MNLFQLKKKFISLDNVENLEVVNYGFVGRLGIQFSKKYGPVYNIKGNKELAINLINGTKFLFRTQKNKELKELVSQLRNKTKK